jgi:tetratricopeptide (TPR) repeat protein
MNSGVYYRLASDLKSRNKFDDAKYYYDQAISFDNNNAKAYIDLADIYTKEGNMVKGRELLDIAQKVLPSDNDVRKKYNTLVATTSSDPLKEALELIKKWSLRRCAQCILSINPKMLTSIQELLLVINIRKNTMMRSYI